MINNLQRKVIVVQDRDEAWNKMISRAIDYGWSVAFPQWESDIIDVGDAVIKYGKLLTMKSILHTTVDTKIKIELQRKLWYNKI